MTRALAALALVILTADSMPAALTPAQRATIVATMRAYEAALEKQAGA